MTVRYRTTCLLFSLLLLGACAGQPAPPPSASENVTPGPIEETETAEPIPGEYQEQLNAYLDELKGVCSQVPVEYTLFNTSEAYEVVLRRYFASRWGGAR